MISYSYMINFPKKTIFLIAVFFIYSNVSAVENNQDLINLVKPGTVSIVTSIKGNIGIPNFIFDIENNTISTTTRVNGFSTTSINNSMQGTGFILSSDGIIITHSSVTIGDINNIYRSETAKYLQNIDKKDQKYNLYYKTIFDYIKENSIKDFKQDIKILTKQNNYPAEIIHSDFNLENDDAVTLLKIEAENLPSIPLSNSSLNIGESLYSISYPVFENLNSDTLFSQGIVNSIKNNLYQTNILSPKGSIGSPVFDKEGNIVGVLNSNSFVLPSSYINKVLTFATVELKPSFYSNQYKEGVILLENNRCKKALEVFYKAQNVNPDFSVTEYLKPKIDQCEALIVSGKSRDNLWDEIVFMFKNNLSNIYLWTSLIFVLLLIMILYKYILNRLHKDEDRIDSILGKKVSETDIDIEPETETEIVENKTNLKTNIKTNPELEIKTVFEPIKQNLVEISSSASKYTPLKKIEVKPKPESPQAPVTPPNAIQPEGPVVVITPFKTLSMPIRSLSSDSTEMKRDIKTDLPTKKKEDDIL